MAELDWLGATGGWNTAGDWSTGTVPGTADSAVIAALGSYTVTVDAAAVGALALQAGEATLLVAGTLDLAGGALQATAGTLNLAGTLRHATLTADGAGIAFAGGTLDGVTWRGPLAVSGPGSAVTLAGSFYDVDTITLGADGLLDLSLSSITLPALTALVVNQGGTIALDGTLDATGQTLAIAPGGEFDGLILRGLVLGGTIDATGGSPVLAAGTLSGITWLGTLDLAADFSSVLIENGFTLASPGGGRGAIALTGLSSRLAVFDAESLDNAAITLASAGNLAGIVADDALTLGPGVTIAVEGSLATGLLEGAGTITNQGLIGLSASQNVTIDAAGFVNAGMIEVGAGGTLAATSLVGGGPRGTGARPTRFVNAGTIAAARGAMMGLGPFASFENTGLIAAHGATVAVGAVSGPGTIALDDGAVFAALDAVDGQTVDFAAGAGTLDLAAPASFAGTLTGFSADDALLLVNSTITGLDYVQNRLTLAGTFAGTQGSVDLLLPGDYAATDFAVVDDGEGDAVLTVGKIPCFVVGTRILAEHGPVPVEMLRVGDRVRTEAGLAPVIWTGRRTLDPWCHPDPLELRPVRFATGAIAPGVPGRPLRLSPDHGVALDGLLIPARHLVNGATIRPCRRPGPVTYVHIELERHAILFAEGMPAESYLDTGNRAAFAGRPWRPRTAASPPCAPLAVRGPAVEAVRARLLARAAALGHAITADPALRLHVAGRLLDGEEEAPGRFRFALPRAARRLEIRSRAVVAAEVLPCPEDRRRLGVAIAAIALRSRGRDRPVPLEAEALHAGWHGPEADEAGPFRWTDGRAVLRCPPGAEALVLTLRGSLPYRLPLSRRRGAVGGSPAPGGVVAVEGRL